MGIEEGIRSQWHLLFMRWSGSGFDRCGEGVNQSSQWIEDILT
ncbi:MAG: hypothetical protein SBU_000289 [Candidatus Syntrophoarchaeum butanivorans]|uniref:Uncharacterized protein n=1 Tax=Candidatus Syntropharchaeum butanivorans TaxID=1839936 RepID=A0A1F2P8Q9_9EURY|nr:MAG: hypothetical protein SBU_000289 [Candidatus Syntrophoarchaeum butanivorans]